MKKCLFLKLLVKDRQLSLKYSFRLLSFTIRKKGGYGTSVRILYLPCYRPLYLYSLKSSLERDCVDKIANYFLSTPEIGTECSFSTILHSLALSPSDQVIVRTVLRALRPECGIQMVVGKEGEDIVQFNVEL